jgi:hypothetical protein
VYFFTLFLEKDFRYLKNLFEATTGLSRQCRDSHGGTGVPLLSL